MEGLISSDFTGANVVAVTNHSVQPLLDCGQVSDDKITVLAGIAKGR